MTQFTVAAKVLCYHLVMQILQITDPHLYGSADGRLRGVETDSSLNAVLDDAFQHRRNRFHRRRPWPHTAPLPSPGDVSENAG